MAPITAFNQLAAEHTARITRINQQGWIWEASPTADVAPVSRTTTVPVSTRQRVGVSIVRLGERLRGTPTGSVADRATV